MPGSALQGDTKPRLARWRGQDRCVDQMVPNCPLGSGEAGVQGRMWRRPPAGEGRLRRGPAPSPLTHADSHTCIPHTHTDSHSKTTRIHILSPIHNSSMNTLTPHYSYPYTHIHTDTYLHLHSSHAQAP